MRKIYVKLYCINALSFIFLFYFLFENDVKMYGTQATRRVKKHECKFENDVKMYGIQAYPHEVKGAG